MTILTALYHRYCNTDREETIAKTIGFILSLCATLSGMYSPHAVAVVAMVGGCDVKKEPPVVQFNGHSATTRRALSTHMPKFAKINSSSN